MPTMAFDPESIRSWTPPDGGELLATDVFTDESLGLCVVAIGVTVLIPGVDAPVILTTAFDARQPHDVHAVFDARYRMAVAELERHRATVAGADVAPTSWRDLPPLL